MCFLFFVQRGHQLPPGLPLNDQVFDDDQFGTDLPDSPGPGGQMHGMVLCSLSIYLEL
jgi:hypothetical protein